MIFCNRRQDQEHRPMFMFSDCRNGNPIISYHFLEKTKESVAVAENIWYVDDVKFYRSMLALHRGASVTIAS